MTKKKFDFENVEVGEDLGTKEMVITDEMVKAFTNIIESKHPWYLENSPFGTRIAPPTILDDETLRMLDSKYERFGSIHARQEWEFKNPIPVGEKITINVRIADKYKKRGLGYYVMELVATNENGAELCRCKHHGVTKLERTVEDNEKGR